MGEQRTRSLIGEACMIRRMVTRVRAFSVDEAGLETVEYAITTGLIVSGTIASVTFIGGWVSAQFGSMTDTLTASGARPSSLPVP